jgi:hypothetical protein
MAGLLLLANAQMFCAVSQGELPNRMQEEPVRCTAAALAGQTSINVKHSMYGA